MRGPTGARSSSLACPTSRHTRTRASAPDVTTCVAIGVLDPTRETGLPSCSDTLGKLIANTGADRRQAEEAWKAARIANGKEIYDLATEYLNSFMSRQSAAGASGSGAGSSTDGPIQATTGGALAPANPGGIIFDTGASRHISPVENNDPGRFHVVEGGSVAEEVARDANALLDTSTVASDPAVNEEEDAGDANALLESLESDSVRNPNVVEDEPPTIVRCGNCGINPVHRTPFGNAPLCSHCIREFEEEIDDDEDIRLSM